MKWAKIGFGSRKVLFVLFFLLIYYLQHHEIILLGTINQSRSPHIIFIGLEMHYITFLLNRNGCLVRELNLVLLKGSFLYEVSQATDSWEDLSCWKYHKQLIVERIFPVGSITSNSFLLLQIWVFIDAVSSLGLISFPAERHLSRISFLDVFHIY